MSVDKGKLELDEDENLFAELKDKLKTQEKFLIFIEKLKLLLSCFKNKANKRTKFDERLIPQSSFVFPSTWRRKSFHIYN